MQFFLVFNVICLFNCVHQITLLHVLMVIGHPLDRVEQRLLYFLHVFKFLFLFYSKHIVRHLSANILETFVQDVVRSPIENVLCP